MLEDRFQIQRAADGLGDTVQDIHLAGLFTEGLFDL
jgi:hypothetical protein